MRWWDGSHEAVIRVRYDMFLEELDEKVSIKWPMNNHPIDESIISIERQNTPLFALFCACNKSGWLSFFSPTISTMHCMFICSSLFDIHQHLVAPAWQLLKPFFAKESGPFSGFSLQLLLKIRQYQIPEPFCVIFAHFEGNGWLYSLKHRCQTPLR